MPEKQTAVVTFSEKIKKDNGWYEGKDGEGRVFSTKKSELGTDLLSAEGQVEVEYTVVQKGDFTNRYIEAIRSMSTGNGSEGVTPATTNTGSRFTKAAENPTTQRSIIGSVALEHAVATMTHTITPAMTAKEVYERVIPVAASYNLWLLEKAGLATAEDVPF